MGFLLTILGSNSAIPSFERHPTAQVLQHLDQRFLIDCGEGTQMQLARYGVKFHRISKVFISHLHGDHYFGLIGLLSTLHLQGRTTPMTVYGPKELQAIIEIQLSASQTKLRFDLDFIYVEPTKAAIIVDDKDLTISSIILNHRIPCTGFVFKEKCKSQKTYAYCSDTLYDTSLIPAIQNADLLYHEATFMEDLMQRAKDTFHSTAIEAGRMALHSNAGKLIIGHFSSRYKVLEPLLLEAKSIFENTFLAIEGHTYEI
jgi:ribonuclease Z